MGRNAIGKAHDMCMNCSLTIATFLRDVVDLHGVPVVMTVKEVETQLQKDFPYLAHAGSLRHFTLCARRSKVGIAPYNGMQNRSVIILFDAKKFASAKDAQKGEYDITPDAQQFLSFYVRSLDNLTV